MANLDFKNCLGSVAKGTREVYFQFNRTYDVTNDIWYKINNDFIIDSWESAFDYESTDQVNAGDPRTKESVESFKESLTFTMKESYNLSFYRELYDIMNTDEGIIKFVNGGLNIKIIIQFGEGQSVTTIYNCCTAKPSGRLFHQSESAEASIDLEVNINFEAVAVIYENFVIPNPLGNPDVTADITANFTTNILTVTIANLTNSNLIKTSPSALRLTVQNADTGVILATKTVDKTATTITATLTPPANIIYNISYLFLEDTNNMYYKTIGGATMTI